MERFAHDARGEHLLRRHLAAEHRIRIVDTVGPVFHDDLCQLVLRDARFAHETLRAQCEIGGRRGKPRFFTPRLEERRPDDPTGHLLDPEHECAVVLTSPDGPSREHERGAAACTPGLDVDDGDARAPERAEHFVAGGNTGVGGAAERGLELWVTGVAQRLPHRGDAEVGDGPVLEPAEGMHADPRDLDDSRHGPAAGANVYVTTSVPSSSVCRGASAKRTGMPNESCAASACSRRVITRTPSGSSTTPNPNGTSPRYPGGAAMTAVQPHNVPVSDSSTRATSSAPQ